MINQKRGLIVTELLQMEILERVDLVGISIDKAYAVLDALTDNCDDTKTKIANLILVVSDYVSEIDAYVGDVRKLATGGGALNHD